MGADENPEIQNKWADGVTYGIAASQKDQSAWETGGAMGTSVFTQYLLKGLGMKDGVAAADENDSCGTPDHIVTHTELQQYLVEKVPAASHVGSVRSIDYVAETLTR